MTSTARSIATFLIGLSLFFVGASVASAHQTGASWEQVIGKNRVDIGYDPAQFQAGLYTRFDFSIKNPTTLDPQNFAEVWVRILDSNKSTLLATGIRGESVGPTTLLYTFQSPGSYTLDTSFRDADGNEIVDAQFPISVAASSGSITFSGYLSAIVSLLAGVAIGFGLRAVMARRSSSAQMR